MNRTFLCCTKSGLGSEFLQVCPVIFCIWLASFFERNAQNRRTSFGEIPTLIWSEFSKKLHGVQDRSLTQWKKWTWHALHNIDERSDKHCMLYVAGYLGEDAPEAYCSLDLKVKKLPLRFGEEAPEIRCREFGMRLPAPGLFFRNEQHRKELFYGLLRVAAEKIFKASCRSVLFPTPALSAVLSSAGFADEPADEPLLPMYGDQRWEERGWLCRVLDPKNAPSDLPSIPCCCMKCLELLVKRS